MSYLCLSKDKQMNGDILCPEPADFTKAASAVLSAFPQERIFALHGPMGAGKTTLIQAFCRELKVQDLAASPTFALVNEYLIPDNGRVYHFDFYRIDSVEEVYDIGYEDYFFSGHHCFLEWPERIPELLPEIFVYITIADRGDGTRRVTWKRVAS